jgi:hypothetical protein
MEGASAKGNSLTARHAEFVNVDRHVEARRSNVVSGISNR